MVLIKSHITIHQDGTCNGLQHYAAMGRDYEGGNQVNLVNQAIPSDIYTHVANLVEVKIQNDLDDLNTDSEKRLLAGKLRGKIKRKIVKQTVMTTVYGVTFIGNQYPQTSALLTSKVPENKF
jgi:DNA-directed RNA polymerase